MIKAGPQIAINKRLLVVEDNPVFVEQLLIAISRMPDCWDATSCSNGNEAMQVLESARPRLSGDAYFDLALVDLGLPDLCGIEVIRACRQRFPEMPIMVVSVIAAENMVLRAIEAGANGYLLKDDSVEQITQGVAQIMDGIYPLSPSLARLLFKRLNGSGENHSKPVDFKLSPREHETLQHLAQGFTYEVVATKMNVSISTIQSNVRNIYRKLNVHSQMQAVSKARDLNLI